MRKVPTVLCLAGLGNALEIYDYVLYGIMLPVLIPYFFPMADAGTALTLAFLSFALTFLVAPLGSLFWGWYGDRFGRLSLMRLSLYVMAFPSLAIALLPSYATWGWWAPVALIACRLVQGLSASGEIMGSRIFAIEMLGSAYAGRCSGWMSAAGGAGVILATGMGYWVSLFPENDLIWRLPFLVGSFLFFLARWMRSRWMVELAVPPAPNDSSLWSVIQENAAASGVVFLLGAGVGVFSYTLQVFINPYLIGQGQSPHTVYTYSMLAMGITMLSALWIGWVVDRLQASLWRALKMIVLGTLISGPPAFLLTSTGGEGMFMGYMLLSMFLGFYAALAGLVMVRLFKKEQRCRGVLLNYALGCSLFGGSTPLLLNVCVSHHILWGAGFLFFFSVLLLGAVIYGSATLSLYACSE